MRHHSGLRLRHRRVAAAQHCDPDLDVLTLRAAYLAFGRCREVPQVAVLDSDQIGFSEREVEVEVDEGGQRGLGVGRGLRDS